MVSVDSTPQGAKVYVDKKYIGTTPCQFKDSLQFTAGGIIQVELLDFKAANQGYVGGEEVYPVICCCDPIFFFTVPKYAFPEKIMINLQPKESKEK